MFRGLMIHIFIPVITRRKVHLIFESKRKFYDDGVLIPTWHVGYADGTSPHVLEVALPAASGAYVDLGQFYDVAALRPKREVLADLTEKYRAQYVIAYKALAEAKRLHDELEAVYNPHVDFDGVYALAKEHILRLQTEN